GFALGARHRRVRHRSRMRHQTLDAAERLAERKKPKRLAEAPGRLEVADLERNDAAETGHLPPGELVLRMLGKARVMDSPHLGPATPAAWARSASFKRGLVGDSRKSMRVAGLSAASMAAGWATST